MKNIEYRNLIIRVIAAVCIFLIVGTIIYSYQRKSFNEYSMKIQAGLINQLVLEHPELEGEIIKSFSEEKQNYDMSLLEKYGITEKENQFTPLTMIAFNKFVVVTLVLLLLGITVAFIIYIIDLMKFYRHIDRLNKYIRDILCGRETTTLKDYEEGMFSVLKNDIYKITLQLIESRSFLKKDKKYLEETLSDISHQLKTPLTSMYMINDLLDNEQLDYSIKKEFLMKNRQQLERIEWLVTSLLKLSKLESGTIQLKRDKVSLKKMIDESITPLQIPIELKNQSITIKIPKNVTIVCDMNWTREAIINIIKNAHEHTKSGGEIFVSYIHNPIYEGIMVRDTGDGISKEDILHVFERFYKGKKNDKDSIGIGLYMAKNIMDRQNGTIEVIESSSKGTSFLLKFYRI